MWLVNWFRKRLGIHVCEEFTRWETRCTAVSRPVRSMEERVRLGMVTEVTYTHRWQERVCTICGKMFTREVDL